MEGGDILKSIVIKKDADGSTVQTTWSLEEKEKFIDGIRKFGRDWKKITQHVGETKTVRQVYNQAYNMLGVLKKNPDLPHKDILAILETPTDQAVRPWAEDEEKQFIEGLDLYGKNYDKLAEHIGTGRSAKQIRNHFYSMKKSGKYSHELLQEKVVETGFGSTQVCHKKWSPEEQDQLINAMD